MVTDIKNSLVKLQGKEKIFSFSKPAKLAFFVICLLFCGSANASDSSYLELERNATLEANTLNKAIANTTNLKNGSNSELNDEKIAKKSKELEGVFLSVMLDPMFPEGKESNLYGGGEANGVFRTMMIQEYGKSLADAGGVGLAKGIEKQFKKKRDQ